ncbi:MAG: tyrosine-type recombinase/integrase [Candidatus Thermoplasmatota archaeon]|nr:tyrosine-type recombinase/integrase [Candidatus Thermoplasmatota archaeon]
MGDAPIRGTNFEAEPKAAPDVCPRKEAAAERKPSGEVQLRGKHKREARTQEARDGYRWTLKGCERSVLDAEGRGLRSAVAPGTDTIYRARHTAFQTWLEKQGVGKAWSAPEVDRQLVGYFDAVLDGREPGGKASVGQLLAAVKHAYPEWSLPIAGRYSRRVVPRVAPAVERKGLPMELVLLACVHMRKRGWLESAVRTMAKFDCLCRGEDMENLRVKDVVLARGKVVLRLGTPLDSTLEKGARVERTKTGADGGVIVSMPWLASEISALARGRDPDEYLFLEERDEWERRFREVFTALGVDSPVPHQLRHGGASWMVEQGKSLADVQLRGRWQVPKSVARYAKPWAVLIAWAKLPPRVAKDALEMGRDPAAAWHGALATERALEPFF